MLQRQAIAPRSLTAYAHHARVARTVGIDMLLTPGLTSSNTDEWPTPDYLFDELNKEFNFNLDVCATDHNHKCDQYFTKEIDGLSQDWKGVCWMNPPYGRTINQWLKKAVISARGGGYRSMSNSSKDRHALVERLCSLCIRVEIYHRACKVWKIKNRSSIPIGNRDIWNSYDTKNKTD